MDKQKKAILKMYKYVCKCRSCKSLYGVDFPEHKNKCICHCCLVQISRSKKCINSEVTTSQIS